MSTTALFYEQPTNIDYLLPDVRLRFGDLTGGIYSDTIVRTAIISSIKYLESKWSSKYLVYNTSNNVTPQPTGTPNGFVVINTKYGAALVANTIEDGDVFRNPYIIFEVKAPPVIEGLDETAIILAAVYILRLSQVASSATVFTSWSTEDISYSNLGAERTLSRLLEIDKANIDGIFNKNIGRPIRSAFALIH